MYRRMNIERNPPTRSFRCRWLHPHSLIPNIGQPLLAKQRHLAGGGGGGLNRFHEEAISGCFFRYLLGYDEDRFQPLVKHCQ